jgi:non-ribosomal peptide synthase protein (TIGR01720 family)
MRAEARTVRMALDADETRALLDEVPKAYHTRIDDVLLTALVQAFAPWTGASALLVDLEGDGREAFFEEVDLSRTVGWVSAVFPALLDLGAAGDPGAALKAIKEQLRAVPHRGIGYGALRYLSGDTEIAGQLRALPQADVRFAYLGQCDQLLADSTLFRAASKPGGTAHGECWGHQYRVEIEALIAGGQLQLAWTYDQHAYQTATVEGLAHRFMQALRSLIAHCLSRSASDFTPSDFPVAGLSQEELDDLLAEFSESVE